MRRAEIYYKNILAGMLDENEDGYSFVYFHEYLNRPAAEPVSLTLPLSVQPYCSKLLFPFLMDSFLRDGCLMLPYATLMSVCLTGWGCFCFVVGTASEQ